MRGLAVVIAFLAAAGCHRPVTPDVLHSYQDRPRYTCCNIRYEGPEISDANYHVGSLLPLGTPVVVQAMTNDSVTIRSAGAMLTLYHKYGADQEPARAYFDKIIVLEDPSVRLASFPKSVREAIREGRVERGMTQEEVLMSVGYPPTHRTPSVNAPEWTYWNNRWMTYRVVFDEQGLVTYTVGSAPTRNEPVSSQE